MLILLILLFSLISTACFSTSCTLSAISRTLVSGSPSATNPAATAETPKITLAKSFPMCCYLQKEGKFNVKLFWEKEWILAGNYVFLGARISSQLPKDPRCKELNRPRGDHKICRLPSPWSSSRSDTVLLPGGKWLRMWMRWRTWPAWLKRSALSHKLCGFNNNKITSMEIWWKKGFDTSSFFSRLTRIDLRQPQHADARQHKCGTGCGSSS